MQVESKKPNFFVLGAPKCGTTSLADWLQLHENVYMCDPKEPHYFNKDSRHRSAFDLAEYESFFSDVQPTKHKAIGEASVWYLISDVAVNEILSYQPDAKFIVCFRNPMDAAISLHDQKLFSGDEYEADFSNAWQMQEARKSGAVKVPVNCVDVKELLYGEACLFGSLLQSLYARVDPSRVLVVLLDDIKNNPVQQYETVLQFLELDSENRTEFSVSNVAKQRKIHFVSRALRRVTIIKHKLGVRRGTGVGRILNKLNRKTRKRPPPSDQTRAMLVEYFKDDIELLSKLIKRDLSHWYA